MCHSALLAWLCLATAALAAADLLAAPPAASQTALPPAITTRQTLFALPFRVERADHPTHEPVEVQLHVSGNRGGSWQIYGKNPPGKTYFLFRAAGDGEFWFAVRTRDRYGNIRPEGRLTPEVRVVVDTTPPKLDLAAQSQPNGEVSVQWRVAEANWKPDSLSLQYRLGGNGAWLPIALDDRKSTIADGGGSGNAKCLPQDEGQVELRAETVDRAGNPAVAHAVVQIDRKPGAASIAQDSPGWRPTGTDVAGAPIAWPSGSAPVASRTSMPWVRPQLQPQPSPADGPAFALAQNTSPAVGTQYQPPQSTVARPESGSTKLAAGRTPSPESRVPESPGLSIGAQLGPAADSVTITWQTRRVALMPRSIALSYASSPAGPWTPIAASLSGTGPYAWSPGQQVPRRVYVKIEARDVIGRLHTAISGAPVELGEPQPAIIAPNGSTLDRNSSRTPFGWRWLSAKPATTVWR